jgi:GNAT superfamily N-acetyltransferase
MSIEPVIRHATNDDLAVIIELDATAREAVASQRGGRNWLVEHAPARFLHADELIDHSWVGTVDEHVVGFLRCTIDDVPQHGLVCSVERVFVDENARELGFGDALLQQAIDYATNLGCVAIEGNALPGDRETKNLYERAGIVARKIIVSRPLNQ